MVEFRAVTKTYAGQPAVQDLTLDIERGSITVFVGPSGCGKTTSLRMINRMVEPTAGSVLVDGQDVSAQPAAALRRSMGYVMQSSGLLPHRTVLDNIATVPRLNGVRRAGGPEARRRVARRRRAGTGAGQPLPGPALRRPAAAGRGGPGARGRSAHPADGRAVQCGGSGGPRRAAAGTAAAATAPGQNDRVRHPRHRRSDHPRRTSWPSSPPAGGWRSSAHRRKSCGHRWTNSSPASSAATVASARCPSPTPPA